jgi:hypothetical protein
LPSENAQGYDENSPVTFADRLKGANEVSPLPRRLDCAMYTALSDLEASESVRSLLNRHESTQARQEHRSSLPPQAM